MQIDEALGKGLDNIRTLMCVLEMSRNSNVACIKILQIRPRIPTQTNDYYPVADDVLKTTDDCPRYNSKGA